MPGSNDWKETGGTWEDDHTLLSEDQLAKCTRAYDAEAEDFPSPVPTRVVSNGEYMPPPQSESQKHVEARLKELADGAAKKLGISRRQFLTSSGGTAAAFLAMNDVHGKFFNVDKEEMFEPAAHAKNAPPKDLFVVDDQLHFVRGTSGIGAVALRAIAQGPTTAGFTSNPFNPNNVPDEHGNPWGVWNPALVGLPVTNDMFNIVNFIRSIYFDSQVTVGLISNVTAFVSGPSGTNPGQPSLDVLAARDGARAALRGKGQPGLHPVPDRQPSPGRVEGLQHLQRGQGRLGTHEAVAARRRRRRLPHLRSHQQERPPAQARSGWKRHRRAQGARPGSAAAG